MSRLVSSFLVACVGVVMYARPVWACATCFGAQDSPQTQGMNMAILTLLGVTYTLFAAMLTTAFVLWRRNRILLRSADVEESPDPSPKVSDPELSLG